jgi:predicted MFS family arabinose efflux permease
MTADRRWPVITALGIEQILAWGMSYYLLTVLAKPISADTGWPLSWVVGSLSVGLLVAGTVSPRVGRLIGTYGGRPVMAVSVILLAVGLVLLGWSPSLPVFVVAWTVLGAGMGAGLYDAAFATLGRLYGATARPSITTLTLWGGFASTVCWPLSARLIELVGWRHTCFIYAAVQLVISLPLILSLPHAPPLAPKPDGSHASDGPLTSTERQAFLLMGAIVTVGGACTAIISVHVLTFLQAKGMTLAVAVALGALIGPSQVGARILEMMTGARFHPLWTLTVAMSLIAIGISLLWAGFAIPAVALILYGAGNGIYSIARGTVPLALFGPERYAPLVGKLAMPSLLAQALTPSIAALVLTVYGTAAALALLAVMALVNVGLVGLLWRVERASRRRIEAEGRGESERSPD